VNGDLELELGMKPGPFREICVWKDFVEKWTFAETGKWRSKFAWQKLWRIKAISTPYRAYLTNKYFPETFARNNFSVQ
jgi:hypothetical protein